MDILKFKPTSKFILTEDFVIEYYNYLHEKHTIIYPKNLVISVRSLRFKATGQLSIHFVVIRSKPIVEMYYKDINKEVYQRLSRWDKNKITSVNFILYNENFERFLNEGNYEEFTDDYNEITRYNSNKPAI